MASAVIGAPRISAALSSTGGVPELRSQQRRVQRQRSGEPMRRGRAGASPGRSARRRPIARARRATPGRSRGARRGRSGRGRASARRVAPSGPRRRGRERRMEPVVEADLDEPVQRRRRGARGRSIWALPSPAGFSTSTCAPAASASSASAGELVVGGRDDHDVGLEREQFVRIGATDALRWRSASARARSATDVGRADAADPGREARRRASCRSARIRRSRPAVRARCAHAYSLECAPMNSKSNGSSVAPAAAIACRVSAGLRA